jgi:hypothetical protein
MKADNGYVGASDFARISVTCFHCRDTTYPKHMKGKQYQRYWDAFHKKWRNKDAMRNM